MTNKNLLVFSFFLASNLSFAEGDWEARKQRSRERLNLSHEPLIRSLETISLSQEQQAKRLFEIKQSHQQSLKESETKNAEIKHSIAILEFVQRIVDLEIKAGRPQPIRAIPSDTPTVGRFLVNCSNTELINPWIFLDVAEKFMNRTWKASKAAINSEAQFKCTKEKTGV